MEKIDSIVLIVIGVISLSVGCLLIWFGGILLGVVAVPAVKDSQPIEDNFYKSDKTGPIIITDHSIPTEAGFVCKHCGEKLYRQHGGTWVHATFDDGGFTNCKDHEDKKANQKNWGKYPNAEPAETL